MALVCVCVGGGGNQPPLNKNFLFPLWYFFFLSLNKHAPKREMATATPASSVGGGGPGTGAVSSSQQLGTSASELLDLRQQVAALCKEAFFSVSISTPPTTTSTRALTTTTTKPALADLQQQHAAITPLLQLVSANEHLLLDPSNSALWALYCKVAKTCLQCAPDQPEIWGDLLAKMLDKLNGLDVTLTPEQFCNVQLSLKLLNKLLHQNHPKYSTISDYTLLTQVSFTINPLLLSLSLSLHTTCMGRPFFLNPCTTTDHTLYYVCPTAV